jgi:3-hydroxyisobutyrate dehydrogenase-like beta-hydroxyacid dehydrogenase
MGHIAFIGTGLIGAGLAHAAMERGENIAVFNRTATKAQPLVDAGARAAETAADAVRGAERVHVALSDDAAVDAVLGGAMEALAGTVVVDHTTTQPALTAARAARLAEAGVDYLHAPVFMSPAMCRSAGGIMLAAGPKATFERVEPALSQMTGRVDYRGERPDAAAAFKLFGNAMILTITGGLADVYAMAASLGISAEDARGLFDSFNPTGTLTHRGAKMAAGNYEASFELTMARKDTRLMIETADKGHPLFVLPALAERMDALIERGHGADDVGVLAVDAVAKTNA